jgi:uncharacterized protein (TIGR02246 family)
MELKMKRKTFTTFTIALALWLTACQQAPPTAAKPDLSAEEAKIRQTDAAWMNDSQARDAARHASYFAEDGSWNQSGYPKATGREAIQKLAQVLFKTQTGVSWTTTKLAVSEAADYAYQVGAWELIDKDAKGKSTKTIGKFVTVWKKQPDGSWKVQEDIGNPDGPPTPVK